MILRQTHKDKGQAQWLEPWTVKSTKLWHYFEAVKEHLRVSLIARWPYWDSRPLYVCFPKCLLHSRGWWTQWWHWWEMGRKYSHRSVHSIEFKLAVGRCRMNQIQTSTHSRKAAAAVNRTTASVPGPRSWRRWTRTSHILGLSAVVQDSDTHLPINHAIRLLIIG
jgi:hypothetical protein